MTIDIVFDGQGVLQALTKLQATTDDMTPIMQEIAGVLADETEQAFENETAPDGTPWPALADSTIKQREKHGSWPGKVLQITAGGLAPSISSEYGRDYAAVGTNKVYGAIHQFGGQAGRNQSVTIPARPYLGVSDEGGQEILDIVRDHLLLAAK